MNDSTKHPNVKFPPIADFALDFRSDALRQLHQYWVSKLDGRPMPRRADIEPTEIPRLLQHIALVDVEAEPLRFYFRLIGTHITQAVDRDCTGCYFEEVYQGQILKDMVRLYSVAVHAKNPARHMSRAIYAGKDYRHYESVHLPLSEDGEAVNMILAGLEFFE
jgi:hypothetical protein